MAGVLRADAPAVINYQGKLADASGNPLTGTYPMIFGVYANPTGGLALFADDRSAAGQQVPVTNGVFTVLIGTGATLTGNLTSTLQGNTARYLQVTVSGTDLLPRQRLVASPYALAVAQGAISDAEVASGAGISVTKLGAGTFPAGNYSFSGSTVTVSSMAVTGVINMNSRPIRNMQDPAAAQDAATRNYVDNAISGVVGGGSGTNFVTSTLTVTYSVFMATANGKVGIGTTAPSQKLHVDGDAVVNGGMQFGANSAYVNGYDTVSPFIEFMVGDTGSGNTYGHGLILRRARTGAGATNWGNIGMINDTTLGIGALNEVGTSSAILAIESSGDVGIGTTAPGATLDVRGPATISGSTVGNQLSVTNNNASGKSAAVYGIADSADASGVSGESLNGVGVSAIGGLNGIWASNTSASGASMSLYQGSTGFGVYQIQGGAAAKNYFQSNVGIGTTNPGAKLEVQGAVKIVDGTQGANKVLTSDANGLASWQAQGSGVPAGAVMFFDLDACPDGWSTYAGGQGRYIVGVPPSGTRGGTQGTALTDLENRAVGQHSHAITDPGHLHKIMNTYNGSAPNQSNPARAGSDDSSPLGQQNTFSATTGITINNAGSVAGTNAPYIQLLPCRKN